MIAKIRHILADSKQALSGELSTQIQKFLKEDQLLQAARNDDLLDRVEKAFKSDFEKRSFQGTKAIGDCMKYVGHQNIFNEVAKGQQINEEQLCQDLDRFTQRRHEIAHRGDYDLTEIPPKEQPITKKEVQECIKVVKQVARGISGLE